MLSSSPRHFGLVLQVLGDPLPLCHKENGLRQEDAWSSFEGPLTVI